MMLAQLDSTAGGGKMILLGLVRANIDRLTAGEPIRITRATHGPTIPEGLHLGILFAETNEGLMEILRESDTIDERTRHEHRPHPARQHITMLREALTDVLETARDSSWAHITNATPSAPCRCKSCSIAKGHAALKETA